MTNIGRIERHYRRAKASVREAAESIGAGCSIWMFNPDCPRTIDYGLDHRDPYAYCTDHITPRSKGGHPDDPMNMQPAHRRCNELRGDRDMPTTEITDKHSEDWPT